MLKRLRPTFLAIPFVWLFFFLALNSAVGDSPTMDEQNHLARGIAFLKTGDPRLSLEHPPLVNSISASLLLTLPDLRLPTDHPSWERAEGWYEFADLLLWSYNADVTRMIFLARLPIIFLLLGLGLLSYHVARRFWGRWAALLAMVLILFDPNLMANGRYSTTDLGGTFFLFLAAYQLWRMWTTPVWDVKKLLFAALGMGLAFGSKLSTLGFVPIMAVMAVLPLYGERSWRASGRRLLQFLTAGVLSLPVLWAIFGFEWKNFYFRDELFTFLNAYAGPMPTFWAGVEQIARFSQGGRGAAFLMGEFSNTGFPLYFPTLFLSKTPLVLLVMLVVTAVFLSRGAGEQGSGGAGERGSRGAGERLSPYLPLSSSPLPLTSPALFLLLPALMFFAISTQSALNIGYRHLLPMIPFLWVFVSGIARDKCGGWRCVMGAVGAVILIITTLSIHPHYVSYFNILAGGPANGHNIAVDSNVDWGQDLLRLQEWMAENEVKSVKLAWFGSADPSYYGMSYEPLPGIGRAEFFPLWWDVPFDPIAPEAGVYAISVSNLKELPLREEEKTTFAYFRNREPDARIGYSIFIYEVGE